MHLSADEKHASRARLKRHFITRARKVVASGQRYIVPSKYDTDGNLVTPQTPSSKTIARCLTLTDWKFLETWRRNKWDTAKTQIELAYSDQRIKTLVGRVAVFRDEEVKDLALAQIPSTTFIQARHVENLFAEGRLGDSERDSLKELAKITGSYKPNPTQINVQQNFFVKPQLSPEQEKATREFFDTIAIDPPPAPAAAEGPAA